MAFWGRNGIAQQDTLSSRGALPAATLMLDDSRNRDRQGLPSGPKNPAGEDLLSIVDTVGGN